MALEKTLNLARQDEIPQQFTSAEMTEIKNAISQETANVNMRPYHIYDTDERIVGEWRETIDGVKKKKPMYEKRVTTTVLMDDMDITSLPISLCMVRMYNAFHISDNGFISIGGAHPTANASEYNSWICMRKGSTYWQTSCRVGTAIMSGTVTYTIQYTKTTDQWEVVE